MPALVHFHGELEHLRYHSHRDFLLVQALTRSKGPLIYVARQGKPPRPVRAASAVKYIDPSLKLPQEIQQTGDIFFPTRWMDATLGGHRSPEAAAIVRDFLARALTRAVAICLA